jgi:hypothetical protein
MRLIMGVSIVAMSVVVLAGPAPSKDHNVVVKKMEELRTQMCACKDRACAQHVADVMTKWGQDHAKENSALPKSTDEETKLLTQIGDEMGKCLQKALGGGGDPVRCETAVRNYSTLLFWRDADLVIAKAPAEKRGELRKQKLAELTTRLDNGLEALVGQCVASNDKDAIDCMIAAKTADAAEKCDQRDDAAMDKMVDMMEALGKAVESAHGDCGKMASGLEGVFSKYEGDLKAMKATLQKLDSDKAKQEQTMKKYGPRLDQVMRAMKGMTKCADDPRMKAIQIKLDGML